MNELDYRKIGQKIRAARQAKGWSQDRLSEKCNISLSFMGHIERGTRIMSLETFVSICSALDTGADELLWGVAHPSEAVLELWGGQAKKAEAGTDSGMQSKDADSYSMYIRIMKSVAEIMNEA